MSLSNWRWDCYEPPGTRGNPSRLAIWGGGAAYLYKDWVYVVAPGGLREVREGTVELPDGTALEIRSYPTGVFVCALLPDGSGHQLACGAYGPEGVEPDTYRTLFGEFQDWVLSRHPELPRIEEPQ